MYNRISKNVHDNSVLSYEELKPTLGKRQQAVLSALESLRVATDREIRDYLCLDDMNQVRPRVNELLKMNVVCESGNVTCTTTNKLVRQLRLNREDKNQLKLQF